MRSTRKKKGQTTTLGTLLTFTSEKSANLIPHSQVKEKFYKRLLLECSLSFLFLVPQLTTILMDIFIAGTASTNHTIGYFIYPFSSRLSNNCYNKLCIKGWLLLYMVQYPEIQKKVQAELDEVCGNSTPQLSHRSKYNIRQYY